MSQHVAPRFGAWITLDSSVLAEQVARAGFDFVVVDGQHGLLGFAEMRDALIALTAGGCPLPVARSASSEAAEIGRLLDAGARGLIVPFVDSGADARRVAAAARYPTSGGRRSYSPVRAGTHFGATPGETDAGVLVLPMIETREALDNLDEILDTAGIDGVFVGPYDLSLALGAAVPFEASVLPAVEAAIARIESAAASRGKVAGIYAGTGADAARRAAQGFTFINTTHDLSILQLGIAAELSAARGAVPHRS